MLEDQLHARESVQVLRMVRVRRPVQRTAHSDAGTGRRGRDHDAPLFDVLDPDALDSIRETTTDANDGRPSTVQFDPLGYRIQLEGDGGGRIYDQALHVGSM